MNTEEKIEIMQAYAEGKKLQKRIKTEKIWIAIDEEKDFNFDRYDYRIVSDQDDSPCMTNRQLAEWLARGYGQYSYSTHRNSQLIYSSYLYGKGEDFDFCESDIVIRRWSDEEEVWVSPTLDIYEKDCLKVKKACCHLRAEEKDHKNCLRCNIEDNNAIHLHCECINCPDYKS